MKAYSVIIKILLNLVVIGLLAHSVQGMGLGRVGVTYALRGVVGICLEPSHLGGWGFASTPQEALWRSAFRKAPVATSRFTSDWGGRGRDQDDDDNDSNAHNNGNGALNFTTLLLPQVAMFSALYAIRYVHKCDEAHSQQAIEDFKATKQTAQKQRD